MYKSKETQQKYAVKTFESAENIIDQAGSKQSQMVFNEIRFLRELSFCENFIQIDSVFLNTKGELEILMKFAEYGCLRSYLISRESDPLSETEIKSIMK